MKFVFSLSSLFFLGSQIFFAPPAYSAKCNIQTELNSTSEGTTNFLRDSIYLLNLQLINENFTSVDAGKSRAKLFDTIFNHKHWKSRIQNPKEFEVFWNWVRFQYWGLVQQQAYIKEDQGYRITNDKSLNQKYPAILSFPIYPFLTKSSVYRCSRKESASYPCNGNFYSYEVILSPSLACDPIMDKKDLTFNYLISTDGDTSSITDISFKGRNLIGDSFIEYDNLVNMYGRKSAMNHLNLHIGGGLFVKTQFDDKSYGSDLFRRRYNIKTPDYPLLY